MRSSAARSHAADGTPRRWRRAAIVLACATLILFGLRLVRPTATATVTPDLVESRFGDHGLVSAVRPRTSFAPWRLFFRVRGDDDTGFQSQGSLELGGVGALGPDHAAHALVASVGDGAWSHWHGRLYFSLPAFIDPESMWALEWRVRSEPRVGVTIAAWAALVLAGICSLVGWWHELRRGAAWLRARPFSRELSTSMRGVATTLRRDRFIVALAVGLAALRVAFFPMVANGTDTALIVNNHLLHVPHYPALPALFWWMLSVFGQTEWRIWIGVSLSTLLFASASVSLATCAHTALGRATVVLGCFALPSLPILAGGAYNESLTISFAIMLAGVVMRATGACGLDEPAPRSGLMPEPARRAGRLGQFALVVLLQTSRHLSGVLAMALPWAELLSPRVQHRGRRVAASLGVIAVGAVAGSLFTTGVAFLAGQETDSPGGRPAVEVVIRFTRTFDDDDREALFDEIEQAHADDGALRAMLDSVRTAICNGDDTWLDVQVVADARLRHERGRMPSTRIFRQTGMTLFKEVVRRRPVAFSEAVASAAFAARSSRHGDIEALRNNNEWLHVRLASCAADPRWIGWDRENDRSLVSKDRWPITRSVVNGWIAFPLCVVLVVAATLLALCSRGSHRGAAFGAIAAAGAGSIAAVIGYDLITSAAILLHKFSYLAPGTALAWGTAVVGFVRLFEVMRPSVSPMHTSAAAPATTVSGSTAST